VARDSARDYAKLNARGARSVPTTRWRTGSTRTERLTMAKIHIKVSTGEEFTISKTFYAEPKGVDMDDDSARVQARLMMKELLTVGTDQGKQMHIPHIVYYWIE
jgi:hypothetical protein